MIKGAMNIVARLRPFSAADPMQHCFRRAFLLLTSTILTAVCYCTPVARAQDAVQQAGPVAEVRPLRALRSSSGSVIKRGPHFRLWQRIETLTDSSGNLIRQTNSYTQLGTGLHHWFGGQWIDSSDAIQITPTGGCATNNAHPLILTGNANVFGAVQLSLPRGGSLSSRVYGLSYLDVSSGKSVLISELQDSIGQLISSNEVFYSNAFAGDCAAGILCVLTKAGMEQDIVLQQQPPPPTDYGLNASTTLLQVITEWFNPPAPEITTNFVRSRRLPFDLTDETLRWGSMKIGPGKAFLMGDPHSTNRAVRVYKEWISIAGRQFLVEQIPLAFVAAQLESLPPPPPLPVTTNATGQTSYLRTPRLAFVWPRQSHTVDDSSRAKVRQVGPLGSMRTHDPARNSATPLRAEAVAAKPVSGFLIDYAILDSDTNDFTFADGSTYEITAPVYISGTTTLEGAIIKYDPGTKISLDTIDCETWNTAVLTARDDDGFGDVLADSTHVPSGFYADRALEIATDGDTSLGNLQIYYAHEGVHYLPPITQSATDSVDEIQIFDCGSGVYEETENSQSTGQWTRTMNLSGGFVMDADVALNGYFWGGSASLMASQVRSLANDDGYDMGQDYVLNVNAALINVNCVDCWGIDVEGSWHQVGADPPSASNLSLQTLENASLNFSLPGYDPNGFSISYRILASPLHGRLSQGSGSARTYTPAPGFIGTDVFTYVVNNGYLNSGIATVDITVNPTIAPVITAQPQDQRVSIGSTATFTVGAAGTSPFSYQWQRNRVNLLDSGHVSGSQTAVLTVSGASSADIGAYTVTVSNGGGSTTSQPAVLSLNFPCTLQINTGPQDFSSVPGDTATFSVVAVGAGPLSYQWLKNGVALANGGNVSGANSSLLSLQNVTRSDEGFYSVYVADQHCSTQSSPATLSVRGFTLWVTEPIPDSNLP